jgi:hypothetical protein
MKKHRLARRIAHDRGRTLGYYARCPGEGLPSGWALELSAMSAQARVAFVRGFLEMVVEGRNPLRICQLGRS